MAGKFCPGCGEQTFFLSPKGRKCSRCGMEAIVPPHGGKGGRGTQCSICGEFKVRDGKCTGCGTTYRRVE